MNKEKCVIICSGGLDSTTLVYDLVNQNYNVKVLSFDYGQKHKIELDCVKKTCQLLNLEYKILDLKILNDIAPSALTRKDWQIPEGHYEADNMKQTIVPNRNMVMLSLATAYAIGIDAKKLFYGAHSGDHHIYEDCRPEFVDAMKHTIFLCDAKKIELIAPYSNIDKGDIIKIGLKLKVPYENTWTCYNPQQRYYRFNDDLILACGKCGSCQERLEAFAKNNIKDPLTYIL